MLLFFRLISLFFKIYKLLIIIRVVLDWVRPNHYNPTIVQIYKFTDPLINPIRERLPFFYGIDFSPWVALILVDIIERITFDILSVFVL